MSKIYMSKMDVYTFWSQLSSCYAFYIVPYCIRNHYTEFKIDRIILTSKQPKKSYAENGHTDILGMIPVFFRFLSFVLRYSC